MNYDHLIQVVQIRTPEFLGDVKHAFVALMRCDAFPQIGMGRIEQAVAAGFGFKSHAAALAALKTGPAPVEIDDTRFCARVKYFGGAVSSGVFIHNVNQCLTDSVVTGSVIGWFRDQPFPVPERAVGYNQRPLWGANGEVVFVPVPPKQLRSHAFYPSGSLYSSGLVNSILL